MESGVSVFPPAGALVAASCDGFRRRAYSRGLFSCLSGSGTSLPDAQGSVYRAPFRITRPLEHETEALAKTAFLESGCETDAQASGGGSLHNQRGAAARRNFSGIK